MVSKLAVHMWCLVVGGSFVLGCGHVKESAMPSRSDDAVIDALVAVHGEGERGRIAHGVRQASSLWRDSDGDFAAFAREWYIASSAGREALLGRLESAFETLDGRSLEMSRELRFPVDVDIGPMLPVDGLFAGLDPGAHVTEDLFASRIGFVALLNFPLRTLEERQTLGRAWSRREWAAARAVERFGERVPSEVRQEVSRTMADVDLYVADYNLWMHHLVDAAGNRPFPKGMRLLSHWNLRDELKARYADPDGLAKQRMIVKAMERIVTQTIPAVVIDNPRVDWDPVTNEVTVAPKETVEEGARPRPAVADMSPEPDTRYRKWLDQFAAARRMDPYVPLAPTAIARSFERGREIPEDRVVGMLTEVLSSPVAARVAAVIQKRLGRPLEPADLWYSGFKAKGGMDEAKLDEITRKKYPTADAFAADIPRILVALGFDAERARDVASKIRVDPARGSGHAMEAMRRGDFPRLRTRVGKDGMDFKGYNIAVHELGHNVEQVVSLYDVDSTLMAGVPANALTEAIAFVFQARDLELLGLASPDAGAERLRTLGTYWQTFEIAGVALVDREVWHWLYDHPNATPAELNQAVTGIAAKVWDRYYAPLLGGKGTPLLAIYSHLIQYPLYVVDYPIGHLVAFQIEEWLKGKKPGPEIDRMAGFGRQTPDQWMENATGSPLSAKPLLDATARALGEGG